MLAGFYSSVPWQIYVFTAVVSVLQIFFVLSYNRRARYEVEKIDFNFSQMNIVHEKARSVYQIIFWVVLLVAVNGMAFGATSYFRCNPRELWYDATNQVKDIGLFGQFYDQVYAQIKPQAVQVDADIVSVSLDGKNSLENSVKVFAALNAITNEPNEKVQLPKFQTPPNILIVQLESVGQWAIDNEPSPMPFLKQLTAENVSVGEFHSNSCETNDAEFTSICGYFSDSSAPLSYSHSENTYRCLPQILKEKFDYGSYFFHADLPEFWSRNILIPKWGFNADYQTPFFKQKEYDGVVYEKAIDLMAKEKKPFYAYITAFTTHSPHNNEQVKYQLKHNDIVIEPFVGSFSEQVWQAELNEEDAGRYFGFLKAEDLALEKLFAKLKETGLDKNTIVLIYNDHRFYNFSGDTEQSFVWYNEQPFVMVLPDAQKMEIRKIASHVDIAPTILNLIEGDNYVPEKNFIGHSLYESNFPETVLNKCLNQVYFRTKESIIQGNAKNEMYNIYFSERTIGDNEETNLQDLLKLLVRTSDAALDEDSLK